MTRPTSAPKTLSGLFPDAPLEAFLALVKELDLPAALPLGSHHLQVGFRFHGAGAVEGMRLRQLPGIAAGAAVTLSVRRPAHLPLDVLPVVIHLSSRRTREEVKALVVPEPSSEQLMKPLRHSLVVRGDVAAKRVLMYLEAAGQLGQPAYTPELSFWYDWLYSGDDSYRGYYIPQDHPISSANEARRFGLPLLLEVDCLPARVIEKMRGGGKEKSKPKPKPKPLSCLDVRVRAHMCPRPA